MSPCDECETVSQKALDKMAENERELGLQMQPEVRAADDSCKHRWEPIEGQPLYKCARCAAFMRIIK